MAGDPADGALPGCVEEVRALDEAVGERVAADFARVIRLAEAMSWARERLGALIDAGTAQGVLGVVVREAQELTGVSSAWAVSWAGDLDTGHPSFRALASLGGEEIPAPAEISRTVVGGVVADGRPIWSDDALADARLDSSESVQSLGLRSLGCLPIGRSGALYLHDRAQPGRFEPYHRARLAALCALAAPFLDGERTSGDEDSGGTRPAPEIAGLVGDAPSMRELRAAIAAFAPMPWPALILGETGTGKERVARALHDLSSRKDEPFLPVNCGGIPEQLAESTLFGHEKGSFTGADRRHEGLAERVGRGTLFLDEVAELSPGMQVKLLRVLQEGTFERVGGEKELRFEGRVVAATLRPVEEDEGREDFRDDLYHRLAACVLRVPPLRERRSDIPLLAEHLLERALGELPDAPSLRLSMEASAALRSRVWPGNVRELENTLRAALAHAIADGVTVLAAEHLGGGGPGSATASLTDGLQLPVDLSAVTEDFQRRVVRQALEAADGNRTRAAELLGVSRQWLHRLISRWGKDF